MGYLHEILKRLISLPRRIVVISIMGAGILFLWRCGHKAPVAIQDGERQFVRTPLRPDESLRVSVKRDQIRIIRPTGPDLVTSTRNTEISVRNDGRVVIKESKLGFTFEPGLAFVLTDRAGLALDIQVAYLKSAGLNVGCGFLPRERIERAFRPYVAISYGLPFRLTPNTSVFAGMTFQKDPIVGIKVGF